MVEELVSRPRFRSRRIPIHLAASIRLGSTSEYVGINYNSKTHSVGNLEIGDLKYEHSYGYGFPAGYAQPVSIPKWKVSSWEVFRIISAHDGPQSLNDGGGALILHQNGDSVTWGYFYQIAPMSYSFDIDDTTGQVLGTTSLNLNSLTF